MPSRSKSRRILSRRVWTPVLTLFLLLGFGTVRGEGEEATFNVEVRYPNPYRPGNPIFLKVPSSPVEVSVQVHGMDGSLLRTLQGKFEAGEIEFNWDGRDRGGKALPSGSYILTVDAGRRPFQSLLFLSG